MSDIKITLDGPQGSGKSRLQLVIEKFLLDSGYKVKVSLSDSHHFTVVDALKTLDKK